MSARAPELDLRSVRAKPLAFEHAAQLQALLERCAAYFRGADGRGPGKHAAMERIAEVEGDAGSTLQGFFTRDSDALVGLLELRFDEPGEGDVTVVLLLLEPSARGRGLGKEIAEALLAALDSAGISAVHLGVQDHEAEAHAFWLARGFAADGRAPGVTRYVLPLPST